MQAKESRTNDGHDELIANLTSTIETYKEQFLSSLAEEIGELNNLTDVAKDKIYTLGNFVADVKCKYTNAVFTPNTARHRLDRTSLHTGVGSWVGRPSPTRRVHRWRTVGRPPEMEVSCQ